MILSVRPPPSKAFKAALFNLTAGDSSGEEKSVLYLLACALLILSSPPKKPVSDNDSEEEDGGDPVMLPDLQDPALVEIYANLPFLRCVLLQLLDSSSLTPCQVASVML